MGTFADISGRKTAEEAILSLAFYDVLTGLPNRRLLMDRLAQAVTAAIRRQRTGAVLAATGAKPQLLKLELTESLMITNVEDVIAKMTELKRRGVRFSLDDFGTGYSSLCYLKRLPLDQLKIDQSFVRDLLRNPNDAAIARTIVTLGHSLNMEVMAEGVESAAQCDFLTGIGCDAFQGYFFGRPGPQHLLSEVKSPADHRYQAMQ